MLSHCFEHKETAECWQLENAVLSNWVGTKHNNNYDCIILTIRSMEIYEKWVS